MAVLGYRARSRRLFIARQPAGWLKAVGEPAAPPLGTRQPVVSRQIWPVVPGTDGAETVCTTRYRRLTAQMRVVPGNG